MAFNEATVCSRWKLEFTKLEHTYINLILDGGGFYPVSIFKIGQFYSQSWNRIWQFTIASKTAKLLQRVLYFNSVIVILNKLYVLTNSIVQILSYSMKSCFIPTILLFTLLEVSIPQGKGSIFWLLFKSPSKIGLPPAFISCIYHKDELRLLSYFFSKFQVFWHFLNFFFKIWN